VVEKQGGAAPKLPEPPAPPAGTSRSDAKAMREAAAIDYLQKEAHAHLTASEEALDALVQQRSAAVEHALTTDTGLEPGRVFVTKKGKVSASEGKVRLELTME
jgi:hypothetical protein